VADDVVDRGADGLGEAAVVEVRGYGLLYLHDMVVAEAVEFVGGDARLDVIADHVEDLGGQAAGLAHLLLLFRGLEGDRHGGGGGGLGRGTGSWEGGP
jgi:hypothetical protein